MQNEQAAHIGLPSQISTSLFSSQKASQPEEAGVCLSDMGAPAVRGSRSSKSLDCNPCLELILEEGAWV